MVHADADEYDTGLPLIPNTTASTGMPGDLTGGEADEIAADDFEIEEIVDPAMPDFVAQDDPDGLDQDDELPTLITQLDERPLSVTLLTERLQREVLPRLRSSAENPGYLTLGRLAYAVVALQGSETHLQQVRDLVEHLGVPIVPSRAHHNVRNLPLAAMQEASRRFGDLLQGQPPESLVIARLGYADLPLSTSTRAFLVQAWMGHCLSRVEERQHANRVAAEVARFGTDLGRWTFEALASREALILDNLWSVVRIARKYVGQGVDIDDLIQFGTLGLLRAVEKNDPSKNFRFVTYASSWIWQRITRELADTAHLIRLPVHLLEDTKLVVHTAKALHERTGRPPTIKQVAEEARVTEIAARALLVTVHPISLDRPDRLAWIERHAAYVDEDLNEQVSAQLLHQQVGEMLESLNERERRVLELRFGLDTGEERTLEEAGREFGVTRERIRQIEAKALRKLHHPGRARKLRAYADLPDPSAAEKELASLSPAAMEAALPDFASRERAILAAVFGLAGQKRLSFSKIYKTFQTSEREILRLQKLLNTKAQQQAEAATKAKNTESPTDRTPGKARDRTPVMTEEAEQLLLALDIDQDNSPLAMTTPARTVHEVPVAEVNAVCETRTRLESEQVRALLSRFSDYERLIADALFGVTTGVPMDADEVAANFGVPLDQVANIGLAMKLLSDSALVGAGQIEKEIAARLPISVEEAISLRETNPASESTSGEADTGKVATMGSDEQARRRGLFTAVRGYLAERAAPRRP